MEDGHKAKPIGMAPVRGIYSGTFVYVGCKGAREIENRLYAEPNTMEWLGACSRRVEGVAMIMEL